MEESGFLKADNCSVFYRAIGGSDKAILFIHGNSGSSSTWNKQFKNAFFSDYRLIAIDFPGHGKSPKSTNPEKHYSIIGLATLLKEIIKKLTLNEYILVGLSYGSNLIAEIALQLEACKGVLLIGACLIGGQIKPSDVFLPFPFLSVLFSVAPNPEQLYNFFNESLYDPNNNYKDKMISDFTSTDPEFRAQLSQAVAKEEWSDEISNIARLTVPLAIVFGEYEKIVDIKYFDKTGIKELKNKFIFIPRAGHFAQLDNPGMFNRMLDEFAKDCMRA